MSRGEERTGKEIEKEKLREGGKCSQQHLLLVSIVVFAVFINTCGKVRP
jgi:hypothetical protein